MDMLGHDDITEDFQVIAAASLFEGMEERVPGRRRDEIRLAAVATEGDKVVVALPLISFEAQRHGRILSRFQNERERKRIAHARDCPP
jgi:hypothetical protein